MKRYWLKYTEEMECMLYGETAAEVVHRLELNPYVTVLQIREIKEREENEEEKA